MQKPNLVLIHSFGTNSIILKGLIDYLGQYFNIYFIDLPGFIAGKSCVNDTGMTNYINFVKNKVNSFDINKYWILGISFGFLVANNFEDIKCKGLIALEPYLNSNSINYSLSYKIFFGLLSKLISVSGIHGIIWKGKLFYKFMEFNLESKELINTILYNYNSKAFFDVFSFILLNNKKCNLQKKPCILIINKEDKTIKAINIIKKFENELDEMLLINTTMEHYPTDLSFNYFEKNIDKKDINQILDFINKNT